MTNQEQIDLLNMRVKTRIAPSPIHGVGVFALRDIPKGQKLDLEAFPSVYDLPYSQFSKLFPEVAALLLERFPAVYHGRRFTYPTERALCFMNHSDDANYSPVLDVATKDIKAGEEITENYTFMQDAEKLFTFLRA
jgi:SET domain-containing protein